MLQFFRYSSCLSMHATRWLVIGTMLLVALLPSYMHMAQDAPAGLQQICTSHGVVDVPTDSPAAPQHFHGKHCDYCPLGAVVAVPTGILQQLALDIPTSGRLALPRYAAPLLPVRDSSTAPRGPPAHLV